MKSSGEWQVTGGENCYELHLSKPKLKNLNFHLTNNSKLKTDNFLVVQTCVVMLLVSVLGGCGYHVAGRGDALPKSIHVIAVPALENKTTSYRIEQRLTAATVHEFLAKTPYRVISDPANGDAVLRGKVLGLEAVPLLFDTATGRATTMLVSVKCEVTFEERETGKVLYHTDNFLFRNQYEISTDVKSFFEEQDPALDRLAQDFAARLVAAVTENF
ncbi:MAG TPA: LPS assembly lipoprotein LptE [Candidatus Acidoferrum sp.]|nr:LPS assembly lipoprotein LptE [Candidatus Acidoferrum sp.]